MSVRTTQMDSGSEPSHTSKLERVFRHESSATPITDALALQRTLGNRAVSAFCSPTPVQRQSQGDAANLGEQRLDQMSDHELHKRHDRILRHLHSASPDEQLERQKELGEIGAVLALRSGRTFDASAVERMRSFFQENALRESHDCITTLNEGMKLLLGDESAHVGSKVDETAADLHSAHHASSGRTVGFQDSEGHPTSGSREPASLRESVWDVVLDLCSHDVGWSVVIMSLMDGYHSVTLSIDNRDPDAPRIYWSDPWSSKGGFMEYDKQGLDTEIERLTKAWWAKEAAGTGETSLKTHRAVKMKSSLHLYRVLGTPHHRREVSPHD